MANVSLEHVSKRFPGGDLAVDDVCLTVNDREFLVLVGPSGCGKSTTLRLIAGLERCTSGTVRIGEQVINDMAPKDRDIAMVFQNYALYPHMSVYNNMAFGLRLRFGGGIFARGIRRLVQPGRAAELEQLRGGIDRQVRQTAERLGIEHLLQRKPHQLSGGERQRVALGRAIVRNPAAFLFDEPLSNLDAKLRQKMRVELKRLHRQMQSTMIYVTHDQVEAMTLGDRVAVMNDGRILQVGSPLSIYRRPVDLFVARFIGSVPINLQPGLLKATGDTVTFRNNAMTIEFENRFAPPGDWATQAPVILGFRAEAVELIEPADATCQGQVTTVDRLGDVTNVQIQLGQGQMTSEIPADWPEIDNLKNEATSCDSVVGRIPVSHSLDVGQPVGWRIKPEQVNWFDRKSHQNISKENQ